MVRIALISGLLVLALLAAIVFIQITRKAPGGVAEYPLPAERGIVASEPVRLITRIDFAFILAYATFIFAFGRVLGAPRAIGVLIVLAAIFDIGENLAILDVRIDTIARWATPKWICFFAAAALFAPHLRGFWQWLLLGGAAIGAISAIIATFRPLPYRQGVGLGMLAVAVALLPRFIAFVRTPT